MNKKGITLVSLIITIIILMILLAITGTISMEALRNSNRQKVLTNMLLIKTKVDIIKEQATFLDSQISDTNSIYYVNGNAHPITQAEKNSIMANSLLVEADFANAPYIFVYNQTTLSNLGLEMIKIGSGETYLVDYSNGDVIYPKGIQNSDGTIFYKLSEAEN